MIKNCETVEAEENFTLNNSQLHKQCILKISQASGRRPGSNVPRKEGFPPPHGQVIVGLYNPLLSHDNWHRLVDPARHGGSHQIGPHISALDPEAMEQLKVDVPEKKVKGQAQAFLWDEIKDNPPKALNFHQIAPDG